MQLVKVTCKTASIPLAGTAQLGWNGSLVHTMLGQVPSQFVQATRLQQKPLPLLLAQYCQDNGQVELVDGLDGWKEQVHGTESERNKVEVKVKEPFDSLA